MQIVIEPKVMSNQQVTVRAAVQTAPQTSVRPQRVPKAEVPRCKAAAGPGSRAGNGGDEGAAAGSFKEWMDARTGGSFTGTRGSNDSDQDIKPEPATLAEERERPLDALDPSQAGAAWVNVFRAADHREAADGKFTGGIPVDGRSIHGSVTASEGAADTSKPGAPGSLLAHGAPEDPGHPGVSESAIAADGPAGSKELAASEPGASGESRRHSGTGNGAGAGSWSPVQTGEDAAKQVTRVYPGTNSGIRETSLNHAPSAIREPSVTQEPSSTWEPRGNRKNERSPEPGGKGADPAALTAVEGPPAGTTAGKGRTGGPAWTPAWAPAAPSGEESAIAPASALAGQGPTGAQGGQATREGTATGSAGETGVFAPEDSPAAGYRARWSQLDSNPEVHLAVDSEELGTLGIKLRMSEGTLAARFTTADTTAGKFLEQVLPELREHLGRDGLKVGDFRVLVAGVELNAKPGGGPGWAPGLEPGGGAAGGETAGAPGGDQGGDPAGKPFPWSLEGSGANGVHGRPKDVRSGEELPGSAVGGILAPGGLARVLDLLA
ncbi:MAG: flagellar hook-length control protein FliK [Firmicutes bacterium]|nr:flagellar hook-length control protein FliK [Bacillota bacterium]